MDIKQKAISGAKWITISTITTASVQMLRLMILARFLDKEEFGIVAIITFVLGLTYTFSDVGFSAAIMSKKDVDRKDFSSLFWLQFIVFVFIYIVLSSLSPLIAIFYSEQVLRYLIPIALFDLILAGFGRLYDTVLQKTMQFKRIAVRNITSAFCSIIVAVILAVNGFGIYSMILSALTMTLINHLWNFIAGQSEYKIMWFCSLQRVKPYFKIGIYQTGTQIIDYFCSKFDILIVGKLLGTETLGVYSLAKELVLKIVLVVNSIANRVALPILAHNNENNEVLRKHYCKMINLLSFINFPINVFLCVFSYQIVVILYGQNFAAVAPLVSILAIYGVLHSIGNPVGSLAVAKGRTDISFRYVIVRAFVSLLLITVTALFSIEVVAWGQVLLMVIMFFVAWRMLIWKLIQMPLKEYLQSFSQMGIWAVVIGVVFLIFVKQNYLNIESEITKFFIYGILLFIVFVLFIIVFVDKDIKSLLFKQNNRKSNVLF